MLSSLFHRPIKPFVYRVSDNQLAVRFQSDKNVFQSVELLVHHFDILDTNDLYHQNNVDQESFMMDQIGATDLHDWFETVVISNSHYVFKLTDFNNRVFYYGITGLLSEHQIRDKIVNFQAITFEDINHVPIWFNQQTWWQINLPTKQKDMKLWVNQLKIFGFTGLVVNLGLTPQENIKALKELITQAKSYQLKIILYLTQITDFKVWMNLKLDGLIIGAKLDIKQWTDLRTTFNQHYQAGILLCDELSDPISFINHSMCHGATNNILNQAIFTYLNSQQELKDKLEFISRYNLYNTMFTPDIQDTMINGLMLNPALASKQLPIITALSQDLINLKLWINLTLLTNPNSGIFIPQEWLNQKIIKQLINEALIQKQLILQHQPTPRTTTFAQLGEDNQLLLINNHYVIMFNNNDAKVEVILNQPPEVQELTVT